MQELLMSPAGVVIHPQLLTQPLSLLLSNFFKKKQESLCHPANDRCWLGVPSRAEIAVYIHDALHLLSVFLGEK